MPAVAMTDHGNLFGAVEFYEKARARPTSSRSSAARSTSPASSRFEKEKRERDANGFDAISHLLLLAMNETGYRNLMYLVSKGYLEGFYYKPRIDMDLLRAHHEGLIATSGCLSAPMVCSRDHGQRRGRDRAWSAGGGLQVGTSSGTATTSRCSATASRRPGPRQRRAREDVDPTCGFRWSRPTTPTTSSTTTTTTTTRCSASVRQLEPRRPEALQVRRRGLLREVSGDEMRGGLPRPPVRGGQRRSRSPSAATSRSRWGTYHLPEYQVPAGKTLDEVPWRSRPGSGLVVASAGPRPARRADARQRPTSTEAHEPRALGDPRDGLRRATS